MKDLKITTIQSELHWEDKEQNLKMFEKLINNISEETDLILLPEMFSTGFSMNSKELAEQMNGTTVKWMLNMALTKKCAIAGSIIIEEEIRGYQEKFTELLINCGNCNTKIKIKKQGRQKCPTCGAKFLLRQSGSISTIEKL